MFCSVRNTCSVRNRIIGAKESNFEPVFNIIFLANDLLPFWGKCNGQLWALYNVCE